MNKILTVLVGMLVCISIAGFTSTLHITKTSLSGKITDKATGETLPSATIYFPDLKTGATSLANGTYKIDNLPQTKVLVQVSLLGYKTLVETIDLLVTSKKDFILEPSVNEMNEVVVTGTSTATDMKKNPVPMVLINQQYISQNSSTNIIETLNKVPGVSTLTTGPNVSKPYIRGLGYNRVLTLFDGVRQEGQQWGDEHGIEIDQFLIDRIEVIKGPASLMYGSDALAGVINLLPFNSASYNTIVGNILCNYQTNNKQIASSFNFDGNNNGFVWGLRASHKQASDYQNKYDGRVFGTKFNENDFNGYLGLHKSWGYMQLNFSMYDNLQEIPDGSRDSTTRKFTKQISEVDTARLIVSEEELNSYKIATIHQHVQHYRVFSNSNFILGKSKLGVNIGHQQSIRREFAHPQYPNLAGLYLILNTVSYGVKYCLPEINGFETTVGVNGMYQNNNASKGTEMVLPSFSLFDLGEFVHFKKSIGKMNFSFGARYDWRTFKNDAMFTKQNPATGFDMSTPPNNSDSGIVKHFDYYKHTFSGASGSAGVTYNVSDNFGLKVNIARGYRAPNASEISAKGVHPGTGFQQLGDANVKPEFSFQEDAGIFFNSIHVSGSAEFFHNTITNYIYNEKLSSINGRDSIFIQDGAPFPVFKFKQTTAQLTGGELSLDIHPHPFDWLHFENSVSYITAINLGGNGVIVSDSTKYLPLIPPFHTNTELRANFRKKFSCFSSVFIKVGVQYYAMQNHFYAAYKTETSTPSYCLLDAGMGGDVMNKKGNKIFSFTILATNLADIAYQSNMNRLKYFDNYPINGTGRRGIYNMGRNISIRIIIPINIKQSKA